MKCITREHKRLIGRNKCQICRKVIFKKIPKNKIRGIALISASKRVFIKSE
jgi:hypothetical protein